KYRVLFKIIIRKTLLGFRPSSHKNQGDELKGTKFSYLKCAFSTSQKSENEIDFESLCDLCNIEGIQNYNFSNPYLPLIYEDNKLD
ncbi:hypothetical protein HZS_4065, partial [Henneguya salminicola]